MVHSTATGHVTTSSGTQYSNRHVTTSSGTQYSNRHVTTSSGTQYSHIEVDNVQWYTVQPYRGGQRPVVHSTAI